MLIRTTVEAATRAYLKARKPALRVKSHIYYTALLDSFVDWCIAHNPPIKYLEEMKARTIEEYQGYLKRRGKSENTLHGATQTIKTFLKWCSLDEEFEREVSSKELQKIKIPKVHDENISSFTEDDIEKVFRAIEEKANAVEVARNKAIVYLLLDTGARVSEIVLDGQRREGAEQTGLRIEDLIIQDHSDPRVKLMGKGGKPREVPVGTKTAKALRTYINRYREDTGRKHSYLFLSRGKNPLTVRGLEQIFTNLSKVAEVKIHPHKFRHTFACRYLLKTRDIYGLSRLMGHGSVEVTERYLRTIDLQEVRRRGSIVDDIL